MADDVTVSWWLDTEAFYVNARREIPRMSRVDDGKGTRGPLTHQHRLTAAQKRRLKELQEE